MIDRDLEVPLYSQVKKYIIDRIRQEGLKPGDKIPAEDQLVGQLGISRGTVRKAVDSLVNEGKLEKKQGYGTFVTSPRITVNISNFFSFDQRAAEMGFMVENKVINKWIEFPSKEAAGFLHLAEDEKIIRLERLRFIEETPVSLANCFIVNKKVPDLDEKELARGSVFDYLYEHFAIVLTKGDEYLDAVAANHKEASVLNIKLKEPLLRVRQVVYDQYREPVCFTKNVYPYGRISYHHSISVHDIETKKIGSEVNFRKEEKR